MPWFWLLAGSLVVVAFAAVYMRNDLANALKPNPGAPLSLASHQVQVVDGDTIRISGQSRDVSLVGFDAPETSHARCDHEREHGYAAMRRLRSIVDTAELQLQATPCGCAPNTEGTDACNRGRSCGILRANGWDVGERLIAEGLAVRIACTGATCPQVSRLGATPRDNLGGAVDTPRQIQPITNKQDRPDQHQRKRRVGEIGIAQRAERSAEERPR